MAFAGGLGAKLTEQLNLALIQRGTPELSADLEDTLAAARQALAEAVAANAATAGAAEPELLAAAATLDAVTASPDAAMAALREVEGRLPQTSELLVARLFEEGRPAEATSALVAALGRWPAAEPLHALARTWRDSIPDAAPVLAALDAPSGNSPLAGGTRGYLLLGQGIGRQKAGDSAAAAAAFERGAAELERIGSDALADRWELTSRRGDCLIDAGWQHYALAHAALASGGLQTAQPALQAAEADFSAALDALPDDADAVSGIDLTGDMYLEGGSQEGIRDFFARMARRHERAAWWNNAAFFCRETKQYEESYAAYEHCIRLAPDNARYVNDTGLILLYHLHRDLPRAEELFRRSIELGKAACANPFIEPDRYDENFLAYTDAMLNLAKLQFKRGEPAAARATCDELLALAPERPDARELDAAITAARAPTQEH